jgi:hypothetical protein
MGGQCTGGQAAPRPGNCKTIKVSAQKIYLLLGREILFYHLHANCRQFIALDHPAGAASPHYVSEESNFFAKLKCMHCRGQVSLIIK